jgi:hypothetical protein
MQTRSSSSSKSSHSDNNGDAAARNNASVGTPAKRNARWNTDEESILLRILFEIKGASTTSNSMFKEPAFVRVADALNQLPNQKGAPKTKVSCQKKWKNVRFLCTPQYMSYLYLNLYD